MKSNKQKRLLYEKFWKNALALLLSLTVMVSTLMPTAICAKANNVENAVGSMFSEGNILVVVFVLAIFVLAGVVVVVVHKKKNNK